MFDWQQIFIYSWPTMLVAVAGIVYAARTMPRWPEVSKWVIGALAIYGASPLLSFLFYRFVFAVFGGMAFNSWFLYTIAFFESVVACIPYVLLLIALFAHRAPTEPDPFAKPPSDLYLYPPANNPAKF